MSRGLLSLLLACALAACGASFAFAAEDTELCDEEFAGLAQVDLTDEELLDEDLLGDEDWFGEEEPGDEVWDEEEDLADEEYYEDDLACDDESDEEDGNAVTTDGTAGNSRVRRGGRGADRFIGDSRVNRFFGGAGDDYLDGAGGSDELNGGPDRDTLITGKRARKLKRVAKKGDYANGGRGGDVIRARNGRRDQIFCGAGKDVVQAERGDVVSRNCETVKYG